jgi:hypothetical protein
MSTRTWPSVFVAHRGHRKNGTTAQQVAKEVRGPIEQVLRIVIPDFNGAGRAHRHDPFVEEVPGFFEFLAISSERHLP